MSDYHRNDDAPPTPDATLPRVAHWERRVAIFVAVLLVVVTAGWAWWQYLAPRDLNIPDHTLSAGEVQEVIRIIDAAIIHEEAAEAFAQQYGTDALGILVPIMRDPNENPSRRGRAAYLVGKYRHPEYTQDIISVVEQSLQPRMDASGLAGVAYAIEGLGWAGDERAIQALKTLAGQAFWDQREPTPYKLEPADAPRIQRLLRERAVLALGRAPDGAGIQALKELDQSAPALDQSVGEALSNSRLRRWGLAE